MGCINLSLLAARVFFNSSRSPQALNDNGSGGTTGYNRFVFTPAEMQDLGSLYKPFVRSGQLSEPIFKKGEDNSCIILDTAADKQVVLAIVKHTLPESLTHYSINFGRGYEPTATLNFSEILRLSRIHLMRSLSPVQRAFSLV